MQLWKLPEISIAPEVILGSWITNTLICTWVSIIALFVFFYFATRRKDTIPSGLQNFTEWVVEGLLGIVQGVSGKEKARRFFPIMGAFFFFIVFANLLDVIPGVDTIGTMHALNEQGKAVQPVLGVLLFNGDSNALTPWIRPATTDLNLNIAMAITSIVITQVFGFMYLGAGSHLSKYFNFKALFTRGALGAVDFFVGILEVVGEVARIISFAFRLFGNIFAGSILLAVFAFLLPALANIIFIPFELFVAAIQGFVFAFLTLLFMELATTSHASHKEHGEHGHTTGEAEAGHETVAAH